MTEQEAPKYKDKYKDRDDDGDDDKKKDDEENGGGEETAAEAEKRKNIERAHEEAREATKKADKLLLEKFSQQKIQKSGE